LPKISIWLIYRQRRADEYSATFTSIANPERSMNRYTYTRPAERLMTIEEAKQLSGLDEHYDARTGQPVARRNLWSWQSVEGAMSQTVTEAQVDELMKRR
jgi:hypothetical protein